MIRSRFICIMLACGLAAGGRAEGRPTGRIQIYRHVERLDRASGEWRVLNAAGRITVGQQTITVAVWYTWGDEQINPLLKIELPNRPERDSADGTWSYRGRTTPRSMPGKDCQLKSCTKIADNPNPDFTVIVSGRQEQYRMSRKTPQNHE